jgi:predicted Rossmann-fold nucleotide-binding protein
VNKDLVQMDSNNSRELLSKLKPLVGNNRQWDHFSNYLDSMVAQHHKVLEQSENMITVHKAQGAIDVLRKIKRLREDVANAEG